MGRIDDEGGIAREGELPSRDIRSIGTPIDGKATSIIESKRIIHSLLDEEESVVELCHPSSRGKGHSQELCGSYPLAVQESMSGEGDNGRPCGRDGFGCLLTYSKVAEGRVRSGREF